MRKRAVVFIVMLLALASLSYAQAPVPFINLPLVPDATPPGGIDFTLTVNGTGFVSNSVVNWNGAPLATQFVSQAQLTATVPAADIATASTAWVTVVNPAPGGGTSNTAFFTIIPDTGNSADFTLSSSPEVGDWPTSVAVSDFNGDGKQDLAVADSGFGNGSTVSILLGDGKGNFIPASSLTVGRNPQSVAVGDFNGDGKQDLAVVNMYQATVSILLGDGTGNFTLVSSPYAGYNAFAVAVGDINRDGKLDLAVADWGWGQGSQSTVSVLLGDGTGNFTLVSSPLAGENPYAVAMGDFNGDGNLDLAVANYCGPGPSCVDPGNPGTLSILVGDGTGTFTLASSPVVGLNPSSVAVGDFNGDGKLDIAVAHHVDSTYVLLGDGTGNFILSSMLDTGTMCHGVVTGDFNGDRKLDLAFDYESGFAVPIWLGDGTGDFTLASSPSAISSGYGLAVGDFNSDGKLDLAVANWYTDTVSILLGVPPNPAVTLSPANLTFGTQLFGTFSSPQYATLTNTGNATLKMTSISASPNFAQKNDCPSELAAGAQCTIGVELRPHNVGTLTGAITIADNAPNSPQTIPLTGVGTAVTLLPSSLNFGDQLVGTDSHPQIVTLTNYAPAAVRIFGGSLSGSNSNQFALRDKTCGSTLPAGESCTISILFAPRSKGTKTAIFEVNDNAGASPQTVSLSGNGTH